MQIIFDKIRNNFYRPDAIANCGVTRADLKDLPVYIQDEIVKALDIYNEKLADDFKLENTKKFNILLVDLTYASDCSHWGPDETNILLEYLLPDGQQINMHNPADVLHFANEFIRLQKLNCDILFMQLGI